MPRVIALVVGCCLALSGGAQEPASDRDIDPVEVSVILSLIQGRGADGLADIGRLTAADPSHPRAWAYAAQAHLMAGNWEEALRAASRQLEVDPDHPVGHRLAGMALMQGGRRDEAIAAFERQLARSPLDGTAHLHLGTALLLAGRHAESLEALSMAVSIQPENYRARAARGMALLGTGRRAEGLAEFRELEELDHPDLLVAIAVGVAKVREFDFARRLLLRAVEREPEHRAAWLLLGNLALGQADTESAARHFERHLEIRPGDARATALLRMARGDLRDDAGSAAQIDALAATDEARAQVYLRNGIVLCVQKRYPDAIASFDRALALRDDAAMKAPVAFYLAMYRLDEKRATALADSALAELVSVVEAMDFSTGAAEADRRLTQLAATWSTMGLVAFMNLDLETAKPYLAAGLLLGPRAEAAELLAQIHEHEKDAASSRRYFAVALAIAEDQAPSSRRSLQGLLAAGETVDDAVRSEMASHRDRLEVSTARPVGATGVSEALVRLARRGEIVEARLLAPQQSLEPLLSRLVGLRFDLELPPKAPATLVARIEIDCGGDANTCVARLLPPSFRF